MSYQALAKMIDHSLLHPTMTDEVMDAGIQMALDYGVASVCIMPYYLRHAADRLAGSTVHASTTIGFPLGGHTTAIKVAETERAIDDGCQEFDVVTNISKVLSGDWDYVSDEIRALSDTVHSAGHKIKVIFENCYLQDDHKVRLCEICNQYNADWVKTSTGFGTSGATIPDLILMRKHAAPHVQVKAAGGVRDAKMLVQVRDLGVTRVGTSGTAAILDQVRADLGLPAISASMPNHPSGY